MMIRATRIARRRSSRLGERAKRLNWFLNRAGRIDYGRYNRWQHRRMALKLWKDFS